jgi:hypothetical protein
VCCSARARQQTRRAVRSSMPSSRDT